MKGHPFYGDGLTAGKIFVDAAGRRYALDGYWDGQTVVILRDVETGARQTLGTSGHTVSTFGPEATEGQQNR